MSDQKHIINNLHRTQGQLEGIERMMTKKRSCDDIITQLMAARSLIERIAVDLLEDEARVCLQSPKKKEQARIRDIAATLFKYT